MGSWHLTLDRAFRLQQLADHRRTHTARIKESDDYGLAVRRNLDRARRRSLRPDWYWEHTYD